MQRPDELTDADIERVLALLRAGLFDHVELEVDGVRIVASNEPLQGAPLQQATVAVAPAPLATPARLADASQPSTGPSEQHDMRPPAGEQDADSGNVVEAPMAGIFYHRPNPDVPPFVEIGALVPAGETIGLIEVMKLFTAIKADAVGVVVEFLAADGEQVVKGQPLIRMGAEQPT